MANTIHVGKGSDKYEFKEAVEASESGDTILIDPGVYNEVYYTIYGLNFKGLGNNASDVVLNTSLCVDSNCYLSLENLTINSIPNQNALVVSDNAQFEAKEVMFKSSDPRNPTVAVMDNAQCTLNYCEVRSIQPTISLYVNNAKVVNIENSIVYTLSAAASTINVNVAKLDYMHLENNSNFSAEEIHFTNQYDEKISAVDSKILINTVKLPFGSSTFNLENASVAVADNNAGTFNRLNVNSDQQSSIDIKNVRMQNTHPQKPQERPHPPKEKASNQSALDELNELIGLDEVKHQVDSFIKMAIFNTKRVQQGLNPFELSLNSMFLGNPGTGKTTVARIVAKAMYENNVLPTDNYVEVSRADLVAEYIGQTEAKTQKIVESAMGGVLFIDEAYTLIKSQDGTDYGKDAVEVLLKYMEDQRSKLMIIFAGYTKEMNDFLEINPGLKSRIPNVFTFEDYSPAEIEEIGINYLHQAGLTFDEDYYRRALRKSYSIDYDGSNARWVRNFNEKLIRILAESGHSLTEISNDNIDQLSLKTKENNVEAILRELDDLVGLASVKKFVHETVKQAAVDQKLADHLPEEERPSYHMVFEGEPGTGKTTVARIIAKLFSGLGILPKDTVLEVSRADLIAEYEGQSEIKTKKVIRDAMGGVLFVDEAYQLNGAGKEDYGKVVIETFITELENNREKFITIFAGYTKEMEEFLGTNPGLRSRIPLKIEFDSYSPEDIAEIVTRQITKNWQVNVDLLKSIVTQKYANLPVSDQSNGRWARNYSEQLIKNHKIWLADHPEVTNFTQISDEVLTNN
ncbi:AAA family ATPase [Xylocopilactobacillus apicola]|uniref:ATPase n=1 Tax=Xylocopilactobacillus apicola TaxID=2932184 RepID=A0AAU9D9X6_9LACO|nr:AAA family ATPase [Xylocopilactobacillus apicola]BDR59231.1 ATPase [Xylocopilactobacillus apicola]